ncbi:hypothetical protein SCRES2_gp78 [Synechococcus phage S-CRES2]|nr:hypothetical protein SCRES1_gp72 [Synechococcus phage S-CRES1]WGL30617.1 hypothetical protein SCRES2_gp78 [Synechococcus phage S-CRES2]
MAKLPFVVAPRQKPVKVRIGTEESGIIEIERKGYLTAGEKSFMQANGSSDKILRSLMDLSRRVASDKKITLEESYELVSSAIQGDTTKESTALWKKYEEELSQVTSNMVKQSQSSVLLKCFCLLLYRVSNEFEFEQVLELHEDIILGLADLYDKEDQKSNDRLAGELADGEDEEVSEEKTDDMEELEKK